MQTFNANSDSTNVMLHTKNFQAAQNARCEYPNCRRAWADHFAGVSKSIPQGACPFQFEHQFDTE